MKCANCGKKIVKPVKIGIGTFCCVKCGKEFQKGSKADNVCRFC